MLQQNERKHGLQKLTGVLTIAIRLDLKNYKSIEYKKIGKKILM